MGADVEEAKGAYFLWEKNFTHQSVRDRTKVNPFVYFEFKPRATDLGGELSQPCGDRQTLFEQQAVEGVAAESLQIHLVFIIPELFQGVCTDCCQESETKRETRRGRSVEDWKKRH